MSEQDSVLTVEDLEVYYETDAGPAQAVDGVSFDLQPGETLGIVGESGCGKTTLAKSIIGILPSNGYVNNGRIQFNGSNLTELSEEARRQTKWEDISMIPQSAMNGLDPVYTIREQIVETIETHRPGTGRVEADRTVDEMFDLVGLDPERADEYPHQFSGGMRQRAMIAMALALDPDLILADEPTTALDVIMQDQILNRIETMQNETQSSMLVITHDVSVVAETCDRVLVMYAGQVAEQGPVEDIFGEPYHPYTIGLTQAFPDIRKSDQDLMSMDGTPPELVDPPSGCRFADRCPLATDRCRTERPPEEINGATHTFCHHTDKIGSENSRMTNRSDVWAADATQVNR